MISCMRLYMGHEDSNPESNTLRRSLVCLNAGRHKLQQ